MNQPQNIKKPLGSPFQAPTMDKPIARASRSRRMVFALTLAFVVIAAGCGVFFALPAPDSMTLPRAAVSIGTAKRAPFQDVALVRSDAVPLETYIVTAPINGTVGETLAVDGEIVTKGQPLARLLNPEFLIEEATHEGQTAFTLGQAQNLLSALDRDTAEQETRINDTLNDLHKASLELSKQRELFKAGLINRSRIQPYEDDVAYQSEKLARLKAQQTAAAPSLARQKEELRQSVEILRRTLDNLRHSLDSLTITAPANGRLTGFDVKPGQAFKASDNLAEIASENAFKLRAQVDEFYAERLAVGLKAGARIGDKMVSATVNRIFRQVVNGRIGIELIFNEAPPLDLRVGQTVEVRITLGDTQDAVIVPGDAWLQESGGVSIFVLDPDGKRADRRPVRIGRHNPESVEILSGLDPGDRVLTAIGRDVSHIQHILFQ